MGCAPLTNILRLPLFCHAYTNYICQQNEFNLLQNIHLYTNVHKNLFAQQAPDLLEKMVDSLLYNFHREQILLELKKTKLLRKISSKNVTAGV